MGKFDGFLICSDLDGTFRFENSVEINSKAVKYFIENGGKFTFATGRSVAHLRLKDFYPNMNAPACLCNGGLIYDYEKEKLLVEERLPFFFKDFLKETKNLLPTIVRWNLFNSCSEDSLIVTDINQASHMYDSRLIKIVCVFESLEDTEAFRDFALKSEFFKDTYISKSWNVGLEFNALKATKGTAVEYIKNYLGNVHTTIGVGDYENDLTLITDADIGVAPANAIDLIKEKADFVVCHAGDGAIKDIIDLIDKGIISRF